MLKDQGKAPSLGGYVHRLDCHVICCRSTLLEIVLVSYPSKQIINKIHND